MLSDPINPLLFLGALLSSCRRRRGLAALGSFHTDSEVCGLAHPTWNLGVPSYPASSLAVPSYPACSLAVTSLCHTTSQEFPPDLSHRDGSFPSSLV